MLGEETVLIQALEGKRGQPDQRPPYPAEKGLFERPTVVNNVQTLAAVPWIVRHGGDAFAAIGAPDSPGTVLVAAARARAAPASPRSRWARRSASSSRSPAAPAAAALKAVLVGGPTGGLLPAGPAGHARTRSTRCARPAPTWAPARWSIADDRACVVDLARLLTKFSADSACGKSIPCRIGLRRLYEIGDRVASGTPQAHRPGAARATSPTTSRPPRCATTSAWRPSPFTSAMRYFRSELDDHLLRSTCPAGVCTPIAVGAGATAAGPR